jgi:hypothetical protein
MKIYVGEDEKLIEPYLFYSKIPQSVLDNKLWFHHSLIFDEETKIKLLISTYKSTDDSNNSYPPGSIVVSNKIYNEFPITQSLWTMDNRINRGYVDLKHRSKSFTFHSITINDMLARALDVDVKTYLYSSTGATELGSEWINKVFDLKISNKKVDVVEDVFQFRNYLYPIAYMEKRLVYVEDTTK